MLTVASSQRFWFLPEAPACKLACKTACYMAWWLSFCPCRPAPPAAATSTCWGCTPAPWPCCTAWTRSSSTAGSGCVQQECLELAGQALTPAAFSTKPCLTVLAAGVGFDTSLDAETEKQPLEPLPLLQVMECGTNLDPGFPAEAAFKYHVRVQPLHLFQVRRGDLWTEFRDVPGCLQCHRSIEGCPFLAPCPNRLLCPACCRSVVEHHLPPSIWLAPTADFRLILCSPCRTRCWTRLWTARRTPRPARK